MVVRPAETALAAHYSLRGLIRLITGNSLYNLRLGASDATGSAERVQPTETSEYETDPLCGLIADLGLNAWRFI